jgi:hypothetical protein
MKSINKKRVENLERAYKLKDGKPTYALVIYDASENFDISELNIDAETVVFLPDNGRGLPGGEIPKGSYKVFLG